VKSSVAVCEILSRGKLHAAAKSYHGRAPIRTAAKLLARLPWLLLRRSQNHRLLLHQDAAVVALAAIVAAPPTIESHAARQPQNHKLSLAFTGAAPPNVAVMARLPW
jgi:hypothetical protein